MGSCLGRILSADDEDERRSNNHRRNGNQQRRSNSSRRRHRQSRHGLGSQSRSGDNDDDVPLINGASDSDDNLSGSSSRRRRSRGSSRRQFPHLQYFPDDAASNFNAASSSIESNADIKLAQRVGLIQQLPLIQYDDERKQLAKEYDFMNHDDIKQFNCNLIHFRCVICMIEFENGDMLRCLPCVHTFHEQCIDQWLIKSLTCPSCLEPVDAALLATFATNWT